LIFLHFLFSPFFFFFAYVGSPKKWVTTDALSLQYLRSKYKLSALHSKFVKANELFFKTKFLKALSSSVFLAILFNQNYDQIIYSLVNLKS
jgi:hypothetical protein